jgi:predicted dehydrogenase
MGAAKVRVILVGCGYIAQAQHLPNWLRSTGAQLVGVVDARPELLARVSQAVGLPGYATLADALASDRAELVHIATPAPTHCALVDEAVSADRHVLVEKPLSEDVAEARQLLNRSLGGRAPVAVGYPRMFDPDVRWLLAAASAGRFGALKAVTTVWKMSLPPTYHAIAEWPRTTRFAHPDGSTEQLRFRLFDESVHHLHLVRALAGGELRVRDVQSRLDGWLVVMTAGDGVPVTHVNAGSSAHGEEITAYFEHAVVTTRPHASHFPGIGGQTLVRRSDGEVLAPRIERPDAYLAMVEAAAALVHGGEWQVRLASAVDDVVLIHRIVDAFHQRAPDATTTR